MHNQDSGEILDRVIRGGLIFLFSVSLLAFGSVSGWGRATAILLTACLLVLLASRMAVEGEIRWPLTPLDVVVAAFLILFLIQLVVGFPWRWDSGVDPDRTLVQAVERPGWLPSFPGSLDYQATREALVLFLAYAGVFYLVVHAVRTRPQMDRLLTGLCSLAALVAFYGLVEFLSGNRGIFGWREYAPARVRGTLVNPDHFAAYLGAVIPVFVGFLLGVGARHRRRRRSRAERGSGPQAAPEPAVPSVATGPAMSLLQRDRGDAPWERESRQLILAFACSVAIVALVFTLSRGGIVSFLVGCIFFVCLLWVREPQHRRRLLLTGIGLGAAALITWIGIEPVLERFGALEADSAVRGQMYRDTLRMVRDFPILGTGLGTFGRIFPRYASAEFALGVRVSHAHSELLQLAAEGGGVAVLILLLGFAALMRDLLLRRLLGLCVSNAGRPKGPRMGDAESPDSSGADTSSTPSSVIPISAIRNPHSITVRHDPYNIAIAFGCWSSIVVIAVHSLFEFPLRIPANGILAAAVLGIAVVAVGMRLHPGSGEPLLSMRVLRLSRWGRMTLILGALSLAVFMGWTAVTGALAEEMSRRGEEIIAGPGGAEGRRLTPWTVETARNREALDALRQAVWLEPMNPDAQYRMGRLYERLALRSWNAGFSAEGTLISDPAGRVRTTLEILDEAMRRYATAIRLAPPHAEAWGRLGWASGIRAQIALAAPEFSRPAREDTALALAGMRQAIALNPNNRYRYEVLAAFGFDRLAALGRAGTSGRPLEDAIVRQGLEAQRRAVELDPEYLPVAVARVLRYTRDLGDLVLTVPDQAPDTLFAARLLEEQGLWSQGRGLFQRAITLASDEAKPLYYREYAGALTRGGEDAEAGDLLRTVLRFDPQNLDLHLALAGTLHRLKQDLEAVEVYSGALELATVLAMESRPTPPPPAREAVRSPRLSREQRVFAAIEQRFPPPRRTADPLARALGALAAFYHDQQRDDLAVPLWKKAMAATPEDAATAFGLARSYDAVGAWLSAIDYYKRAIELDRGNLEYRLALADRYYQNDMTFQAINLWREIVTVRPTLLQASLKLAAAYIRLEQYPEALREYEKVLQLEPGNQHAREGLSRLRDHGSGGNPPWEIPNRQSRLGRDKHAM